MRVDNEVSLNKSYYKSLSKFNGLTKSEEVKLFKLAKNGDIEARNKLITSNLKYVSKIARSYLKSGIPYSELISEGNAGLFKAFEKFDYTKNVKFYCYGIWWVKYYISSYIKNRKSIESMELGDFREEYDSHSKKYNSIDTLDNSSDFYYENGDDFNPSEDFIDSADEEYNDVSNYDISDEEEQDEKSLSREQIAFLHTLLDSLEERERTILEEYFGIRTKPKTLDEIGIELNLSKERVRQIKLLAMRKLRYEALSNANFSNIYKK